eukprot:Sspe_Gene.106830::Locus_84903_Transcript_1_1_Confidence_1.000_Length_1023::g.106830::m.106830
MEATVCVSHSDSINDLSASPFLDGVVACAGEDGIAAAWDLLKGTPVVRFAEFDSSPVVAVEWWDERVLLCSYDDKLTAFDTREAKRIWTVKCESEVECLSALPSAGQAVAGLESGTVAVVDLTHGRAVERQSSAAPHSNVVSSVGLLQPGTAISVSMDFTMAVTRFSDEGAEVETVNLLPSDPMSGGVQIVNPPVPTCMAVGAGSLTTAVGAINGKVWVLDMAPADDSPFSDPDRLCTDWTPETQSAVESLCWVDQDDGQHRLLWVASRNGEVKQYDLGSEEDEDVLQGTVAPHAVTAVTWAKWLGERRVVVGDVEGGLRLYS